MKQILYILQFFNDTNIVIQNVVKTVIKFKNTVSRYYNRASYQMTQKNTSLMKVASWQYRQKTISFSLAFYGVIMYINRRKIGCQELEQLMK